MTDLIKGGDLVLGLSCIGCMVMEMDKANV